MIEKGKKLYAEAIQLLESAPVKVEQRVFIKRQSSLARSFLTDELQKQKGILPTALRLVTQGFVSFFKSTPPSTSTSSSTKEENQDDQQSSSKATHQSSYRKHRDPTVAKAMDKLQLAGYEYHNDDALWTLANIHFHGQYKARRDLSQAFDMYATLADRSGNATAQQMVGFMYSTGLGNAVERDEAKAMLYMSFAARSNSTAAELTLGYKYMLGIGTKKSCQDSEFYYKQAADKGHAGATTIPHDYQKAGKYLRRVADSFFPKANTKAAILEAKEQRPKENVRVAGITAALLGKMYWRGEGYEVDEKQALTWFKKGALLDNPVALNGLGAMYLHGAAGLEADLARATEYFKKAAELKDPDAQVNMGMIYLQDPKHYAMAYQLFLEASQRQNFQAAYRLGEMYYYGMGIPKNCERASRYFKYVAERGDWGDTLFSDAYEAYNAGDVEYAAIGYLQAAERGIEVGQSNFAWILDRVLPTNRYLTTLTSPSKTAFDAMSDSALVSLGTPSKLLQMALVYWTRSANQGDVDARVKMGDYYFKGIGTEVDFQKATACYQVAADYELSAMAMWNLGWMHENGVGVAKDFHLAKRWYDRSLSTNPGAVLPVSLSLAKLNARFIWNYLTGGETGNSAGSFWSINGKSSGSRSTAGSRDSQEPGSQDGMAAGKTNHAGGSSDGDGKQDDMTGSSSGSGSSSNSWDLDDIGEIGVENWKSEQQAGPGDEAEYDENDPFRLHHNRQRQQQEDEEMLMEDEDLIEGMVIIGLCMVVGYLMYVRQFRFGNQGQQQNQNQDNNNNNNNDNNNNGQQPPVGGLPGDPHAPGR
ncbi:ERAD-associated protein, partial [Mortierella sp. GBA30]